MRCMKMLRTLYLNVIDPHHIAAFQCYSIAAPYVLRVELGDVDVLQDDVASAHNAETFTLDDTC